MRRVQERSARRGRIRLPVRQALGRALVRARARALALLRRWLRRRGRVVCVHVRVHVGGVLVPCVWLLLVLSASHRVRLRGGGAFWVVTATHAPAQRIFCRTPASMHAWQ